MAPQRPAPALNWTVFSGNSSGAQGCVYAVWLRLLLVLDLVSVLVMRAHCPAMVQTVCDCSNLVIQTAKIMTNATDKNIFGTQWHQPLDHWPLLELEILNRAQHEQSIGWGDIYQRASHLLSLGSCCIARGHSGCISASTLSSLCSLSPLPWDIHFPLLAWLCIELFLLR